MTTTDNKVIYHGFRRSDGMGAGLIAVETPDGGLLGEIAHVVKHSPTGMNWGYGGSGPADCARSLLLAALATVDPAAARCVTCKGTGYTAYVIPAGKALEEPVEVPFDPDHPGDIDPDAAGRCMDCDDGRRRVPYQDFKAEVVAGLGSEWRLTSTEILDWLAAHGVTAEGVDR